jgi:hypothetical protein
MSGPVGASGRNNLAQRAEVGLSNHSLKRTRPARRENLT